MTKKTEIFKWHNESRIVLRRGFAVMKHHGHFSPFRKRKELRILTLTPSDELDWQTNKFDIKYIRHLSIEHHADPTLPSCIKIGTEKKTVQFEFRTQSASFTFAKHIINYMATHEDSSYRLRPQNNVILTHLVDPQDSQHLKRAFQVNLIRCGEPLLLFGRATSDSLSVSHDDATDPQSIKEETESKTQQDESIDKDTDTVPKTRSINHKTNDEEHKTNESVVSVHHQNRRSKKKHDNIYVKNDALTRSNSPVIQKYMDPDFVFSLSHRVQHMVQKSRVDMFELQSSLNTIFALLSDNGNHHDDDSDMDNRSLSTFMAYPTPTFDDLTSMNPVIANIEPCDISPAVQRHIYNLFNMMEMSYKSQHKVVLQYLDRSLVECQSLSSQNASLNGQISVLEKRLNTLNHRNQQSSRLKNEKSELDNEIKRTSQHIASLEKIITDVHEKRPSKKKSRPQLDRRPTDRATLSTSSTITYGNLVYHDLARKSRIRKQKSQSSRGTNKIEHFPLWRE